MAKELVHKDAGAGETPPTLSQSEDNALDRHYITGGVDNDILFYDATGAKLIGKTPTEALAILDGTARGTLLADAHANDLDAHTRNAFELLRTGQYTNGFPRERNDTLALTADKLYGAPLLIARDMTVDRIAIDVSAGDAGKFARVGIYENGTNLYPGALVVDGGEINVGAGAIVTATINQALTTGLYWMAIVSDGTPTLRGGGRPAYAILGVAGGNFNTINCAWIANLVYTAGVTTMPDPFTAGGVVGTTGVGLQIRPSSMD